MAFATTRPDLSAAAERFRLFFLELGRTFVERDDLLAQIALALLGREHVLMTGPPGTAKSGVAAAVLGRIVDERTGQPSLFARQFTESTVQTDLVGPIDFKTLMQTGRTEHFTDEGMLGAVHAFLDEVLDGRDMLLRTTLNVLQERELKQGTKTTAGSIECALMTTNRYLAEVLEGSRETLLAFVDRIAFVSFVPKGFAEDESLVNVLRAQVGGQKSRGLKAMLTIQDLDILQAAAEEVYVGDETCAALGQLLEHMDADLAAATKSDPTFSPSRYLSTRTAVRLGKLLRSVAVFEAIFSKTPREMEVVDSDMAWLRLSLILAGPSPAQVAKLLQKETDPRERRQLSILRTEREIFQRALARIPPRTASPRAKVEAVAPPRANLDAPSAELLRNAASLVGVAEGTGVGAVQAATILDQTMAVLVRRALREGTTASAGPDGSMLSVAAKLGELADGLEKASASRATVRWLRGRAVQCLLDAAAFSSAHVGEALTARPAAMTDVRTRATLALDHLEATLSAVATLRAAGADETDPRAGEAALGRALSRVEDELVELWDGAFREAVTRALTQAADGELGAVLEAIGPALVEIDASGKQLERLGGSADSLKTRIVGPRIDPLVRAAFDRVDGSDRLALVAEVGKLLDQLEKRGLGKVIRAERLLEVAASGLVRADERRSRRTDLAPDVHGYFELRKGEQRVSIAFAVVELAFRVSAPGSMGDAPDEFGKGLAVLVGSLSSDLRSRVVALDLGRIERAVAHLERWWDALATEIAPAMTSADPDVAARSMGRLGASRFFHLTRDEGAFARFALECRFLGETFPEAGPDATALRARVEALEETSSQLLAVARARRADVGWEALLGSSGS